MSQNWWISHSLSWRLGFGVFGLLVEGLDQICVFEYNLILAKVDIIGSFHLPFRLEILSTAHYDSFRCWFGRSHSRMVDWSYRGYFFVLLEARTV